MPLTMRNTPNHVNWENNIMTIFSDAAQFQGNLRSAFASDGEQQMLRIATQKLGNNAEACAQFPLGGRSE